MSKETLAIIGAGPKAVSIAVKTHVLSTFGFNTPEIVILEKSGIGANWKPGTGFTNGNQRLGTSADKDIGFPYRSFCWGDQINKKIDKAMQAYSWQSYLIEKNTFSSWIDRGRPQPTHLQWSEYLRWSLEKVLINKNIRLEHFDVEKISISSDNTWEIEGKDSVKSKKISSHGLVLTGPGDIRRMHGVPDHPRVWDAHSVWNKVKLLEGVDETINIAVIGNGETAASTALLLGNVSPFIHIDIITPVAMSYSRGESFVENHMYTDPFKGNWHELTLEDRKTFIERTDRGVFSMAAKKELDQMDNIDIIPGWFKGINLNRADDLIVEIEYNERPEHRLYDFVALSIGFDPLLFLSKRTTPETQSQILAKSKVPSWSALDFEENIGEDLALETMNPRLHLPMIAGLKQGPGFPNLSCLGLLSDQILLRYISLEVDV